MDKKIITINNDRAQKIIEKIGASPDHSCPLNFPEGRYLQGWVLQKISLSNHLRI